MPSKSRNLSGYKNRQSNIRGLVISPGLETVENIYPGTAYTVELSTDEFTTICPKTGLPDFAEISIQYVPGSFLVEEKSLKLYLTGFRNIGIFQENATNKVFEDFQKKVRPRWLKISALWNKRGGIGVRVERETGKR
jgi:7-cyano-7-deazaguanine reductase